LEVAVTRDSILLMDAAVAMSGFVGGQAWWPRWCARCGLVSRACNWQCNLGSEGCHGWDIAYTAMEY